MIYRKSYLSKLNDRVWQILEPLLPAEKPGGRLTRLSNARIINVIQYVLRNGGACRVNPA